VLTGSALAHCPNGRARDEMRAYSVSAYSSLTLRYGRPVAVTAPLSPITPTLRARSWSYLSLLHRTSAVHRVVLSRRFVRDLVAMETMTRARRWSTERSWRAERGTWHHTARVRVVCLWVVQPSNAVPAATNGGRLGSRSVENHRARAADC